MSNTILVGFFFIIATMFQSSLGAANLDLSQEAKCLNCIRNVSSSLGTDVTKRCEGYFCGLYQISYTYWAEAGKPGNNQGAKDFEKCARDKTCAEQTVRAYFKKYKRDCNNDGIIDCNDMAALHKGGPTSCSSDWFYKSRYWLAFEKTKCLSSEDIINNNNSATIPDNQLNLKQPGQVMKNQSLTTECLDCICDAVSGCNTSVNNCGSGTVCGPFAISQAYWKDGKKPGASWTACARTKECSSVTMKNYMEKYKRDCNDDGYITCEDYAAIHRRGPRACSNRDLYKDHYWNKFLACRANQMPMKDVNLVKVNEGSDEQAIGLDAQSSFMSRGESNASPPVSATNPPSTLPPTSNNQQVKLESPQNIEYPAPSIAVSSTQSPEIGVTDLSVTIKRDDKPSTNRPIYTDYYQFHHHNRHHHHHHQQSTNQRYGENGVHKPEAASSFRVTEPNTIQDHRTSPTTISNIEPTSSTPSNNRKTVDYELPLIVVRAPSSGGSSWSTKITQLPTISSETQQTTATTTSTPSSTQTFTTAQVTVRKSQQSSSSFIDLHPKEEEEATSKTEASPQNDHHSNNKLPTQPDYLPAPELNQPVSGDENDYSSSDFSYSTHGNTGNFDKVVNGIVGSPDFTKSYPPIPAIISQEKPVESPNEELNSSQLPVKLHHQKVSTNHSKASSQSNKQPTVDSSAANAQKQTTSKTEQLDASNANPIHQRSTSQQQPQEKFQDLQPILGPDSVNMSNLFDKGLNESSRIASECLECICDASSNCDTTVQCISKQREKNRCGLYMISWNQYQESDISLTSLIPISSGMSEESADEKMYYECTTDRVCAEKLIHLYIEKHQKDCNNDGKIDCYDIAAIHRVGPDNCNSNKFLGSQYWKDFNICYTMDRLTTVSSIQSTSPQLMIR